MSVASGEFYITVPSNTIKDDELFHEPTDVEIEQRKEQRSNQQPGDTTSHFRVTLPQPIIFHQPYKVGLSSVIIPSKYNNVQSNFTYHIRKSTGTTNVPVRESRFRADVLVNVKPLTRAFFYVPEEEEEEEDGTTQGNALPSSLSPSRKARHSPPPEQDAGTGTVEDPETKGTAEDPGTKGTAEDPGRKG